MYRPFKRIRLRMCEMDLNQKETARLSGVPEGTITNRMRGIYPWHADEIAAVAKVLNIPTAEIGAFFFEEAPREYKKYKKGA